MNDLGTLTIVELATIAQGLGTALAAIFALFGIIMVYVQIRENRATQREATAKHLFRQYLQEGLERPDLVIARRDQLTHAEVSVAYEFFVANMLYSFDEVLQNTRSKDWREVVRGEIARHVDYLRSPEFQSKRHYYAPQVIEIIDAVCGETARPAVPPTRT
ncbi:MAG: hypothetical protein JJ920_15705 [Roseitalea sp.]|jgi:hypothetical protein|nr:hypothetical protein [Roseitalea sp.]MBO6722355.1 hypothetical protein [Roseitalea sp.]MBO6744358.1 hypothetical protein [Roseitalea sp.]